MRPMRTALAGAFSAMSHRNYRIYWAGEIFSLVGTWVQSIAQSWLVLELTGSPFRLGLVATIQFLPMMLFSLYAGTLVDRFRKRSILIATQTILMILALILGLLTLFQVVEFWHILVLALFFGLANTIDVPARQSFFIELVGREDFMNAVALNSGISNLSRILGPAVGGLLIGLVGIAPCFLINSASYIPVLITLFLIRPNTLSSQIRKKAQSLKKTYMGILQGLRYIRRRENLYLPLLLLALTSTFTMNFNVMIPIFAQENLGQGATGYGFLLTGMALGSLTGSLILALRSKHHPTLRGILLGALGMSLTLSALGLTATYATAFLLLFATGLSATLFTALINTTLQLGSGDYIRGRVVSVYSLVLGGLTPIGAFYAGNVMEYWGAGTCMILSGLIGAGATAYVWWKGKKREKPPETVIQ